MSRRGPVFEEERFSYAPAPPAPQVRIRERDFEEDVFRQERARPAFLERDEYRVTDSGPLVVRGRDLEPPARRQRAASEVRIREREVVERPRSPQERVTTRIIQRRSPSPQPERLRARVTETRERIRERPPSPPPVQRVVRERYVERERSPSPPQIDRVRIRNVEREVVRQPSPSPSPSPSPPPPIRAPAIHQEIITHHRHIDHGFERPVAPTPPPPPRRETPRTKETDIDIYTSSRGNTEVDIRKTTSRAHTPAPPPRRERDHFYDDDFIFQQERDKLRVRDTRLDITRRRSVSARPEKHHDEEREEAEYYARKAEERAYIGEAFNGATKDWAIVDVPPGTERVRMDGVGGGSQEITWQRYNGVRRSKFIPERQVPIERERERVEIREEPRRETTGLEIEISSRTRGGGGGSYEREYERVEESRSAVGFPRGVPKQRVGDLWTEITKDLVVREAIEELGYDYEETEFFYYIIQYLKYEDVLQLVQLSEEIRRERQDRLRDIERERIRIERDTRARDDWERAERRRERDSGFVDERVVEREIVYDSRGGRRDRRSGGW